jgi:hypothetical protein
MDPKVHYRVHKSPSPPYVPYFSHINVVRESPTNFFKIHSNLTFPSTSRSSTWSLSLRFPTNSLYATVVFHTVSETMVLERFKEEIHLNYESSPFKMTPCRMVNKYQRFGGVWCLHFQGTSSPRLCKSRISPALQKTHTYIEFNDQMV